MGTPSEAERCGVGWADSRRNLDSQHRAAWAGTTRPNECRDGNVEWSTLEKWSTVGEWSTWGRSRGRTLESARLFLSSVGANGGERGLLDLVVGGLSEVVRMVTVTTTWCIAVSSVS